MISLLLGGSLCAQSLDFNIRVNGQKHEQVNTGKGIKKIVVGIILTSSLAYCVAPASFNRLHKKRNTVNLSKKSSSFAGELIFDGILLLSPCLPAYLIYDGLKDLGVFKKGKERMLALKKSFFNN